MCDVASHLASDDVSNFETEQGPSVRLRGDEFVKTVSEIRRGGVQREVVGQDERRTAWTRTERSEATS